MPTNHLELNNRAQGWLNFLYQKATTPDDWSEDGSPNEWWDQISTAPMCAFPRFDLQESTYAIGLMADRTPAWREIYSEILDEIAERSITYWAAVDWLTQFGHDLICRVVYLGIYCRYCRNSFHPLRTACVETCQKTIRKLWRPYNR